MPRIYTRSRFTVPLWARAGLVISVLCLAGVAWGDTAHQPVARFTAVEGNVFVGRAHESSPFPVDLHSEVGADDVVETQPHSKFRLLLWNDTLVTVGENSRIVLSASSDAVLALERGTTRVLAGPGVNSNRSGVAIQTPGGVVTAPDHAYFTVWIEEDVQPSWSSISRSRSMAGPAPSAGPSTPLATGIANLGTREVTLMAHGGKTIKVQPQQYAVVKLQKLVAPPTDMLAFAQLVNVIAATELKDMPKRETPKEALLAVGGSDLRTDVAAVADAVTAASKGMIPSGTITPPAVISGAAVAPVSGPAAAAPAAPPPPVPVTPPAPTSGPPSVSPPTLPAPPPPPTIIPPPPAPPIGGGGGGGNGKGGKGGRD